MRGNQEKFKLKGYKIEEPDMHLGTEFYNTNNINVQECWAIYYEKYFSVVVTHVESVKENYGLMFPQSMSPLSYVVIAHTRMRLNISLRTDSNGTNILLGL